jgi:hypothetical protein
MGQARSNDGLPIRRDHRPRDQRRRFLLHRRDGVRVGVEADRDGDMPEALADDLGVEALPQEQRRVGTPPVVDAAGDAGLFEDPQARLKLRLAVLAQGLGGDLRQGEGAQGAHRLRLLQGDAG